MKKSLLLAGLLAAAGFSTLATAHDYTGTLGSAAAATDKFYIACATGTAKITYQVRRNTGTPNVKAAAYSPVGAVTQSAGTGVFSPLKTVATGGGAKFFQINKTAAGTNSYTLRMHCYDANGLHDPADQASAVTYIQNQ